MAVAKSILAHGPAGSTAGRPPLATTDQTEELLVDRAEEQTEKNEREALAG
jgi:hypothetical protein